VRRGGLRDEWLENRAAQEGRTNEAIFIYLSKRLFSILNIKSLNTNNLILDHVSNGFKVSTVGFNISQSHKRKGLKERTLGGKPTRRR
jgi:hypothetical protein